MRNEILTTRERLSAKEQEKRSARIRQHIAQHPLYQKAKHILFYYPIKNEVDLLPLLKEAITNKKVSLPLIDTKGEIHVGNITCLNHLTKGPYGVSVTISKSSSASKQNYMTSR